MAKSTLHTRRESLVLPMMVSLFAHGSLVVTFFVLTTILSFCGPRQSIIDPDDTMQVAMVELTKSSSKMPDRATRAPKPAGKPAPVAEPVPTPDVKHTSEMAVKVDKPTTKPGVDTKRLEDALAQLEKQQLEADMNAALAAMDQAATDPNGTATEPTLSGNVGTPSDPEFARYIGQLRKLFMTKFQPLPGIREQNPGIVSVVHITVDPTGKVLSHTLKTPSGNASFDGAAMRAVESVPLIPLPPEKYLGMMAGGYDIQLK